jgi:hypothetical protein
LRSVNDAQERLARDIVLRGHARAVGDAVELARPARSARARERGDHERIARGMAGDVVALVRRPRSQSIGITCPFFVSQNDGTLMSPELAARFPVLTFASGPTNSIRGGGLLSGLDDCIVVDIGGTTTDVGVLSSGFRARARSPSISAACARTSGCRTCCRSVSVAAAASAARKARRPSARIP